MLVGHVSYRTKMGGFSFEWSRIAFLELTEGFFLELDHRYGACFPRDNFLCYSRGVRLELTS